MNNDITKIFESYIGNKPVNEGFDADPSVPQDMVKALQEIASELKQLNQYVDFLTTGSRAPGFGAAETERPAQKRI
tara:strand:- start:36 stop:263 length:228 start_codon:yes stop_codon:yes gene_type:complete